MKIKAKDIRVGMHDRVGNEVIQVEHGEYGSTVHYKTTDGEVKKVDMSSSREYEFYG